jgi:parvulin-like peptidyl-prolyl isomerase
MGERGMVPPPAASLRQQMLERLISERAQLQYARELGLSVDDATLAQAELSIARQNHLATVPELHQRIEQEGISVKDFQADVRNQVLLSRLREREIEPRIRVSDADVDAYIREQTGARTAVPELNLAMILVEVPEHASADDVASCKARGRGGREARAGEDFAKLAAEYSDANNRGRDGGVLGLHPLDKYPELFVKSTQGAPVGGIVGPVRSPAGFHVLKVLERKVNRELPEVKIPLTHVRGITLKVGPAQSLQVARERLADFKRRIESGQATLRAAGAPVLAGRCRRRRGRPGLGAARPVRAPARTRGRQPGRRPDQRSGRHPRRRAPGAGRGPARAGAHQRAAAPAGAQRAAREESRGSLRHLVPGGASRRAYVELRDPPVKHIPRKRFGQHFLADPAVIDAIVRAIDRGRGRPWSRSAPAWRR